MRHSARRAEPVRSDWVENRTCPACRGDNSIPLGRLPGNSYLFGAEQISFPSEGISLLKCTSCEVIYKQWLPSQTMLSALFARQAETVWGDVHHFRDEAHRIERFAGTQDFDLLDIGASNGALLDACRGKGRRSALDVTQFSALRSRIRGEFINGFIDEEVLAWSGKPYDVVTALDVVEHLYRPDVAFRNLVGFVKPGGLVLIETGDTDNWWPRTFGLNNWWYIRLCEHHVFWSPSAIQSMAAKNGLEVIALRHQRHKSVRHLPAARLLLGALKSCTYTISPSLYERSVAALGKRRTQPASPFARDQMALVLRRL